MRTQKHHSYDGMLPAKLLLPSGMPDDLIRSSAVEAQAERWLIFPHFLSKKLIDNTHEARNVGM